MRRPPNLIAESRSKICGFGLNDSPAYRMVAISFAIRCVTNGPVHWDAVADERMRCAADGGHLVLSEPGEAKRNRA